MLTGKLPFRGQSGHAVLYSVLHNEPESLASERNGMPAELQHVIDKALAKDPDERYQHVREMIADLRSAIAHR